MNFKLMGSILLVVGTSIGAGMLALPIATAQLGFVGSLILLFICWCVMAAGAFLLLEVNLWMPLNSNINTMARSTIGPIGQIISWVTFLLLLYSVLCAYIGGGSDLFRHMLISGGMDLPAWTTAILFTFIFGSVVYLGIRSVDYVNRGLMFLKFGAYFVLILMLMPLVSYAKLSDGSLKHITSATAITVTMTSFGFGTIVPSLRIYLEGHISNLKKTILIGSLIPLVCYIAWDLVIMGVVPISGEHGLFSLLHSDNSTSGLVNALSVASSSHSINFFVDLFTSVCVLTSFLGVSLCLTDFWADALQLEKKGWNNFAITALTFLPPLVTVLFFPGIFVTALKYAGIYCIILLILLPAWMVWMGRYKHKQTHGSMFTVPGGKILLGGLIVFSCVIIAAGLLG
jgi:tyrosine-specific transport protein